MNADIDQIVSKISRHVIGKEKQVKLALCAYLVQGHVLIEDLPGMGKTSLAVALSKVVGLHYQRVQFTSDMLPSDLLGVSIFDVNANRFNFKKGPIFTECLLADEINRATPKTQSALLEAMGEKQVSIEGETMALADDFFVIATQNPLSQYGTYPLPESQLDRFLISIEMGYPDHEAEKQLLQRGVAPSSLNYDEMHYAFLTQAKSAIDTIFVAEHIIVYVQSLLKQTREHAQLQYGISPRGALALLKMAKAWAFINDRDYLIPEDIQQVIKPVFVHRLCYAAESQAAAEQIVNQIILNTAI